MPLSQTDNIHINVIFNKNLLVHHLIHFLCCLIFSSSARVIRSQRAGVGKSLQHTNMITKLRKEMKIDGTDVTIPVYRTMDTNDIIKTMKERLGTGYNAGCDTIHIDIAHEVCMHIIEVTVFMPFVHLH